MLLALEGFPVFPFHCLLSAQSPIPYGQVWHPQWHWAPKSEFRSLEQSGAGIARCCDQYLLEYAGGYRHETGQNRGAPEMASVTDLKWAACNVTSFSVGMKAQRGHELVQWEHLPSCGYWSSTPSSIYLLGLLGPGGPQLKSPESGQRDSMEV